MRPCEVVVLVACVGAAVGCNNQGNRKPEPAAKPRPAPQPTVSPACQNVQLLHGSHSTVRTSVLSAMCQRTLDLVQPKATSPPASATRQKPARGDQAAMLLIHRDDFSPVVAWDNGDATDPATLPGWSLGQEVTLTNGYSWYRHGLPSWPLQGQALAKKKSGTSRRKQLLWPNYAVATPVYIAASEAANSRDINISVRKLFAGDVEAPQQTRAATSSALLNAFADAATLKPLVEDIIGENFLDQFGAAKPNLDALVRDPDTWVSPLLERSLPDMLDTFAAMNTKRGSKGSNVASCPDEVYLYFRRSPCTAADSCTVIQKLQLVLRAQNCSSTIIVVGYSPAINTNRGPA